MAKIVPKNTIDRILTATKKLLLPQGYSRRGAILRVIDQNNCGIVEFQRSRKSSKAKLLFTINIGIVCGELLDSEPSQQVLQKARTVDAHLRVRIGMFLPDHPDKWWEVTESTDIDSLAREISELILEKAVPYIRQFLCTESILTLWESGQSPGLTDGKRCELLAKLKRNRE
ncbi:MAG: DUF4304 domain-containing protein [Phycisphaerae bacterium]|nr:DUF4304 domain-containing protein [Phycisphaerae bacterium]